MKSYFFIVKVSILLLVLTYSKSEDILAHCQLTSNLNSGVVSGIINFKQNNEGKVEVKGKVENLTGTHGFHIHVNTITNYDCATGGAHYNPLDVNHGSQTSDNTSRHVGDLGNIVLTTDENQFEIEDSIIQLSGDYSIVGRSCMIHEDADDLGLGTGDSLNTGNAGARLACGTILLGENSSFLTLSYLLLIAMLSLIIF